MQFEHEDQEWGALDPARRERLERALTDADAGQYLVQETVDATVQGIMDRELGGWSTLTHRPGSGNARRLNTRTPGTSGGMWVSDTEDSTEETGGYGRRTFEYKTGLTRGRVTRRVQREGMSWGDALATELSGKAEDFAFFLEKGLWTGNAGAGGAVDQPNGLLTLINGYNTQSQVVAVTTAAGGGAITTQLMDRVIDRVKGRANRSDLIIYCTDMVGRKLNQLAIANQMHNDVVEVGIGFRVKSYDRIPIVEVDSDALPHTLTWSGSSITAFADGSTTCLVVVNKRYVWIDDLTPVTVMPLAKTSSQRDDFEMFWDGAPIVANPLGAAILGGISGTE